MYICKLIIWICILDVVIGLNIDIRHRIHVWVLDVRNLRYACWIYIRKLDIRYIYGLLDINIGYGYCILEMDIGILDMALGHVYWIWLLVIDMDSG